jgi:hypothetical protein
MSEEELKGLEAYIYSKLLYIVNSAAWYTLCFIF